MRYSLIGLAVICSVALLSADQPLQHFQGTSGSGGSDSSTPVDVTNFPTDEDGSLGEFNWSSQHLTIVRSCDGNTKTKTIRSCSAPTDAVAWSATGVAARTPAAVLGGDCSRVIK